MMPLEIASKQQSRLTRAFCRWPRGHISEQRTVPPTVLSMTRSHTAAPDDTKTHPFNGQLCGTTRVSRYQKGKPIWILLKQQWQWHQLGHMQVCTSLQTDNHASTSPLSFLQARCPSCHPTNSAKALKATTKTHMWLQYRPSFSRPAWERTGRQLLWSTTLLLPTSLSDSQVSIYLVIRGLWWTVSGQVKANVILTCTNGVSPNHLPVIVASDRPWTTLSKRAH